jgi:hypothetical protein
VDTLRTFAVSLVSSFAVAYRVTFDRVQNSEVTQHRLLLGNMRTNDALGRSRNVALSEILFCIFLTILFPPFRQEF